MSLSAHAVGIGLRQPHYRELFACRPDVDFLEVHSENFFGEGGAALGVLDAARADYPISLHGVGLSIGSADSNRQYHLDRLASLVERVDPVLVSEHLSWGAFGRIHFNDLLPLPYSEDSLDWMVARVSAVQDRLKRSILIENISAYLEYRSGEMSETEFLAALARRSGCGVLLDVNNLYVNARNFGRPVDLSPLADCAIGEIHLAGHSVTEDCLIDDHGSRVCDEVWQLYRDALASLGSRPTLIEWDTNIPSLDVLEDEVRLARAASGAAGPRRHMPASPIPSGLRASHVD